MSWPGSVIDRVRNRLDSSRYLRDVFLQASGNTAAQALGIAAMPLLTRLYAPSDFAALQLFLQAVGGMAILMTLRIEYLVMLPAEQRESDSILRMTVRLGAIHVLVWTPLFAFLPSRWEWLGQQGAVAHWLWLVPVSACAVSLAVALQQTVQRDGNFRTSAASEFLGRFGYLATSLLGALVLPSLIGLMASTLANASLKLLWLSRDRGRLLIAALRPAQSNLSPRIWRLALSASTSSFISLFSGMAPMVFIADQYGPSALGQYGLVVSTLYLPSTLLGQAVGQVYYQRACQLYAGGSSFSWLLIQTSRNLAQTAVPLYGAIAIAAPFLYPLVFGKNWAASGEMASWMCLAAAAGFLSGPLDRTSLIVGAWWYLTCWHLFRAGATALCIGVAQRYRLPLDSFIALLSVQMLLAYAIDWLASCVLAARKRPSGPQGADVGNGAQT